MMSNPTRRQFLGTGLIAGAAIITPEIALAGSTPRGWALGVADVEADVPQETLTLVQGRAPRDFAATLYRNGPAKFRRTKGEAGHWFDGDGLVRRWQIQDGQATLAARFVDTPKRRLETRLDAIVQPGFGTPSRPGSVLNGPDDTNAANTSMLAANGQVFALWEGGSPMQIDPDTLATLGPKTFRRDLKQMPFSAHPRIEPDGTIWNFGGNGKATFIWKLNPDGGLAQAQMIAIDRKSYFHDFTMTARHLVFVLQPWVQEGLKFPLSTAMAWKPEMGTQVLVIDKDDFSKRRIFELPAFAFFHLGDGWEEKDGTIRFDGCLEADPTFGQKAASALLRGQYIPSPAPMLTQIVLHANGRAEMRPAGTTAEFPASDRRLAGQARTLTAHVTGYRSTPFPHAIALWDWNKGRDDKYDFGDHQLTEEFLFIPRGAGERDGWLIGTTLNLKQSKSELHLLDARKVKDGPVATWRASLPLPMGFHGTVI
ncbi:MAG: carotenoid oxygenase family protein [Sphingorhabdus sp.]